MHWRQGHLDGQFPTIASSRYSQLFTLYNSGDVDLTLYWNIPQLKRHGHHYIIGVNLGVQQNPYQQSQQLLSNQAAVQPTRSLFEATAKERALLVSSLTRNRMLKDESPIKLMVETVDTQSHDFDQQG
jgi:hypothetical protein